MNLTNEEKLIERQAIEHVKSNKDYIIRKIVKGSKSSVAPVAIFMAGSPGAGKTEFSKHFLKINFKNQNIVRIDPDEIRELLPGYTGKNSYVFQFPVSLATEKVLDYVFKHNIHFLLDGTLSHIGVARKNISRALKHNRFVQINYVYQNPELAWKITQDREVVEGRRITRKIFEEGLINSREVVQTIIEEYGDTVRVDLVMRDTKNQRYLYKTNITNKYDIDNYIKKWTNTQ